MKLQIDNLDGRGPQDYSSAIDASQQPSVKRRKDKPAELRVTLIAESKDFIVPIAGARVTLGRKNGQDVFTGYLIAKPTYEPLGWNEDGSPVYRYHLVARGDEELLDSKRLPNRSPFVTRSAGEALRQATRDLIPGGFDLSAIQDLDTLASYRASPDKTWSEHAAAIATAARASYRVIGGRVSLSPLGSTVYSLDEEDEKFSPEALKLEPQAHVLNDVIVTGEIEAQSYVKDYFVGDGLSSKFYLSQTPFGLYSRTVFAEEFAGSALDPTRWTIADPSAAIRVGSGRLQVSGGTGFDGQTTISFVEKVELGGAAVLQHGDFTLDAPSDGIIGGLYAEEVKKSSCLTGFLITPNETQSNIQALINGSVAGPIITTVAARRYVFTTRFYSTEVYRHEQVFHSSQRPSGSAIGGAEVAAAVRVVLDVREMDLVNPGSMLAPSTVLYNGTIAAAPGLATYALVNATRLSCTVSFTRYVQTINAEIRSMLPGQNYRSRLVGALTDGAECTIISGPALDFFSPYIPAANELIEVHYRGSGRAYAHVSNLEEISARSRGLDDGVRAAILHISNPLARTTADCEHAALALLDDGANDGWTGEYTAWSDFLPGGADDIFPGDALQIKASSRQANFLAVVTEVDVVVKDLAGEHSEYTMRFVDAADRSLAFQFEKKPDSPPADLIALTTESVSSAFLPSLTSAAITKVTSTTVTIDVRIDQPIAGGIEIRWSDFGWGQENDRNLAGRFTTRSLTLPRLSRSEDYYLRQYDSSASPRYSRYTVALHVDYPF